MSNFYMIGGNHEIAAINSGNSVCSITVSDVIYVYWRESAVYNAIDVSTATVKVSTSDDNGLTWSAPVTAYSLAARDVYPVGVVHNGTNFIMLVAAATDTVAEAKILTSAAGSTFTLNNTLTYTDDWFFPTGLAFDGTTYYMVGSGVDTTGNPERTKLFTSTNYSTWSDQDYADQVNATPNVWPRVTVIDGTAHVVHREGQFWLNNQSDRILHTSWSPHGWGQTDFLIDQSGAPSVIALDDGLAVMYLDRSIQASNGVWCWGFFDLATLKFLRRGTVTQGNFYGTGATLVSKTDGSFYTVYAVRSVDGEAPGIIYFRDFIIPEEVEPRFVPKRMARRSYDDLALSNFEAEISYGEYWISLSDGLRFYMSAEDYGEKAQVLRRITASSPFYDGTYLVHSTRENVTESVSVYVMGSSQNQVTENIALLEELINQRRFSVRIQVGDHRETWTCQPADYTISRGHILMHGGRALVRMQIPRLPDVSYEAV